MIKFDVTAFEYHMPCVLLMCVLIMILQKIDDSYEIFCNIV